MTDPDIPPAVEAEIRERLRAIPGMDLAQGLEHTLNRFPFYVRILRLFITSNSHLPTELRHLANQERHQELLEIVHGLKGSTATIGAQALNECAAAMVNALRNDQSQAIVLTSEFADALHETISALDIALQEPTAGPRPG